MDTRDDRIAELERACDADPGGPGFPALAELHRRAGRLSAALAVARRGLEHTPGSAEGRAALLLILDDAGDREAARTELERWAEAAVVAQLPPSPPAPPVLLPEAATAAAGLLGDDELEQAFERAEPALDEMITPDSVAEEAALRVDGDFASESPLESGGAFATETMAALLERQGDAEGAARIRAALADGDGVAEAPSEGPLASDGAGDGLVLATLERWLGNARRMQT